MQIRAVQIEIGFVALAAVASLASAIIFASGRRLVAAELRALPVGRDVPYEGYAPSLISFTRSEWKAPVGAELFASPVRRLSAIVTASSLAKEDAVEIVEIRPEPFRLRLLGVVGAGDEARGLFEETASGAVLLVRRGETLSHHRLRVEEVGLRPARPNREMSVVPPLPTAEVRDFESDQVLVLETDAPTVTDKWIATLQYDRESREFRVGDSLAVEGVRYRIEDVTATKVVMATESGDGVPSEHRVLVLSGMGTRPTKEDSP